MWYTKEYENATLHSTENEPKQLRTGLRSSDDFVRALARTPKKGITIVPRWMPILYFFGSLKGEWTNR